MGRKNHKKDKDFDELQKLKEQLRKARRTISGLRKVISRVDMEQYSFVKDFMEAHDCDMTAPIEKDMRQAEQRWQCYECGEGILKLITIFKVGVPHYFRKCSECENKTKLKRYTDDVEGIK